MVPMAQRGGMFDRIVRLGEVFFPERQIQIHSRGAVTTVVLSTTLQAGVAGIALVGTGLWFLDGVLSETPGAPLASVVTQLQDQLVAAQQAAQNAESRLNNFLTDQSQSPAGAQGATNAAAARRKRVPDAEVASAASSDSNAVTAPSADIVASATANEGGSAVSGEGVGPDGAADAAALADRLKQLEAQLATLSEQNAQARQLYEQAVAELKTSTQEQKKLKSDKTKMQTRIEALAADKMTAEKEREKVEKQIIAERDKINEKIKQKVAELSRKQTAQGREGIPSVTVMSPRSDAGSVSGAGATANVGGGFSLDRFLAQIGLGGAKAPSVGGPFVAVPGRASDAGQGVQMQAVLRTLPLTPPVAGGQLESRFGVRSDPFNGHQSMHTGLDFSAPYKSPIYNTSPGVVVFAGYAGAYGKLVEVDHGNGIHTKYGHLNRISVNVGQKLTGRVEIGQLGSTGRSTGPHVHYEVLVNGTPQDPERFLEAGRSLLVSK